MDRKNDATDTGSHPSREWLIDGGEMGALIRSLDWSDTSLGPRESWCGPLRTAASMVVASRFPMALLWGRDLVLVYNDAYRVIVGGKHPAALGRPTRHAWPEVWHINAPIFAAVMERGETIYLEDARFPINRNGHDEEAYFTLCYSPVRLEDGAVGGALVTLQETTAQIAERKHARNAVRESTALLQAISDTSADVIFAKDAAGRIRFANPATLALIGKTAAEVIGKTDAEFLADAAAARAVMENDRRIMERGVAEDVEERVPMPDGTDRIWSSRKAPLRDAAGEVVGLVGISRDITDRKRAEEAVRAGEERYRSLFTNMTEGFAVGEPILDDAGVPRDVRFLEMNAAFERHTGLDVERTRGRPLRQVLPGIEPEWIKTYGAVALTGTPVQFENYNRDLDRHFSVYCYRPSPGRFAIVFTDVTARKRTEEASARDHELLTRLVERLPVMITMYHLNLGGFRFNAEFKRVLGWTEEDAASGDLMALGYPDPKIRAEAAEHMRSLAPGWRELPVVAKDGTVVPSSWANLRLSDDTQVGIGIDLRERKQAERAVRESEQRLRSVLENMVEGLVIFDAHGNITHQNPASVRIHDRKLAAERSRLDQLVVNWRVRTYPDGATVVPERWAIPRVLRGDHVRGERFFVDCLEDPARSFVGIYSGSPVYDAAGQFAYGFLTIEDITDQARAEAALREAHAKLVEADRRKDDFLGMLSHELRNPLAPIRNSLYMLDRAETNSPQARRAKDIANRQLAHLTRLVDDLLDVTRIARGKIDLRRSELDVAALARRTAEDHRQVMQDRHIELDLELPDDHVVVNGDETRLAQVLGNLLHNAAKFTPAGGRVTLSVAAEGGNAVLRVRDTGAGIEPGMLQAVFEPFTQAKQTLARSEGGLGLGLALVKGLVAMHGGEVTGSSEGPGRGTEFVVTLPLARAKRDRAAANRSAFATPEARRRRVLVIDDNHDAADSLAQLVSMMGHDVDVTYDAFDGLASATDRMPDVVLCDIGLPGMDGYEFARQLRALSSEHRVRLVAVSGYAQPEDVARAVEAGFDTHVAKPPDPEKLASVLG